MITTPRLALALLGLSLGVAGGCARDAGDEDGADTAETQPAIEAAPVAPAPAPVVVAPTHSGGVVERILRTKLLIVPVVQPDNNSMPKTKT